MKFAFTATFGSAARRSLLGIAAVAVVLTAQVAPARAEDGETMFKTICLACHTIGAGKRVGPDLKGVHEKRSEDWLVKFIKSSTKMIQSGDPDAVAIYEEYEKVPMPDAPYSEDQIKVIIAYIKKVSDEGTVVDLPQQAAQREATPEDIERGRQMFQGRLRFKKGGPACNSCHDVKDDAVIGGGVLAKELTTVFSRVGAPGVAAVLGKPPFPVMSAAYNGRALEEDEVFALVSFLQEADKQKAFQQPRDYGMRLFGSGVVGLVVLMGFFSLIWGRRKKQSVNQAIYDRQVKSQ